MVRWCLGSESERRVGASGRGSLTYAGSRSPLVSHRHVDTDASAALTTGMFAALAREPGLGRAEALRRSMLAVMASDARPYLSHPAAWAPFVVVGEGGAAVGGS
jgi:CHAT domain-containing protein